MSLIFDFSKTYTGAITYDERNYPCSLIFLDDRMIFTVITASFVSIAQVGEKFDLSGIISTEKGLYNFRATDAMLISHSYSKQQFEASGLLVSYEKDDLFNRNFRQGDVVFDRLDETGLFLDVRFDPDNINLFNIQQKFKELILFKSNDRLVKLVNFDSRSFGGKRNLKLAISINPFLTIQSASGFDERELTRQFTWASWFFQLIFGLKQPIISVVLFHQAEPDFLLRHPSQPCYYFHANIIRNVRAAFYRSMRPLYLIEDLLTDLPQSYTIWEGLNENQRLICRLYFNELNTHHPMQDNRFKNFCAIIQGLEHFIGSKSDNKAKGGMNRKLQNTLDEELKGLLFPVLSEDFLKKLFERVGDQRDLFQHLNKPIKFDFNNNKNDIIAVNQFLSMLIRYHIRKTIALPKDKLLGLTQQDFEYVKYKLLDLKQRLN